MRKVAMAALAAMATISVLAAACGGDDGDGDGDEPTMAANTPIADITPFNTPQISGNNIVSPAMGYSATFPDGWSTRINFLQTTDGNVDAFFAPLPPGAEVQASITVNCVIGEGRLPADQLPAAHQTQTAREGLNENVQVSTRQIAGVEATAISYTNTTQADENPILLDKTDYVFAGETCNYELTTTTAEGERAAYQAQFDIFLNSFAFVD
jgi:hypothetical protein